MINEYYILYANPHIRFSLDNMKYLTNKNGERVIVKAKSKREAEKKAHKKLVTTGMCYEVELK